MNFFLLLVLAQLRHHPAPAPVPDPVAVEGDGGLSNRRSSTETASGREPSWVSQPNAVPAPIPVEHAPWWIYAIGIGLLLSPALLFLRRKKDPNAIAARFSMAQSVIPAEPLPVKIGERTPEACYGIYLEGVEGLVKRHVWPEKLNCIEVKDAPMETRWRAWLALSGASAGGDRWEGSLIRANGRTQGQALKGLLRIYREHGGAWTAHALERSEKAIDRSEKAVSK